GRGPGLRLRGDGVHRPPARRAAPGPRRRPATLTADDGPRRWRTARDADDVPGRAGRANELAATSEAPSVHPFPATPPRVRPTSPVIAPDATGSFAGPVPLAGGPGQAGAQLLSASATMRARRSSPTAWSALSPTRRRTGWIRDEDERRDREEIALEC